MLELDSTLDPPKFEIRFKGVQESLLYSTAEKIKEYLEKLSNNPFKADTEFLVGILDRDDGHTVTVTVGCRIYSRRFVFSTSSIHSVSITGVEKIYEAKTIY